VHDHFEESDCGNADVFEVVGVSPPGASIVFGLDGCGIVGVESVAGGIGEGDGVLEL
jgi:hypothetical protein